MIYPQLYAIASIMEGGHLLIKEIRSLNKGGNDFFRSSGGIINRPFAFVMVNPDIKGERDPAQIKQVGNNYGERAMYASSIDKLPIGVTSETVPGNLPSQDSLLKFIRPSQ